MAQRIRATSMKSNSTGWKLPLIIGVLVIVALLINIFFHNKAVDRREAETKQQRQAAADADAKKAADKQAEEQKEADAKRVRDEAEAKAKTEEKRKKASDDAIAEHALFLARYLNSGFTRKPGVATVGVAIESEQGTMNAAVADALIQRFNSNDILLLNSFFKPEFVADKYVASVLSGDTGIFDRLELTNRLNGVLIGRQAVTYSTNATLENTITANLRLELMVWPVGFTGQSRSWALSANGVGFNNFDALQQAEDRIIHRIASDSTLSLSNLSTNK
jgi:hypothetical protein